MGEFDEQSSVRIKNILQNHELATFSKLVEFASPDIRLIAAL
jgi:hypothetical protein